MYSVNENSMEGLEAKNAQKRLNEGNRS